MGNIQEVTIGDSHRKPILMMIPSGTQEGAIGLQAMLLYDVLKTYFLIDAVRYRDMIIPSNELFRNYDSIIYHFGSFNIVSWRLIKNKKNIFVFHNITPYRHLFKYKPVESLLSLAGYAQLRLMPKDTKWVAVSPYNANLLKSLGYFNVKYCPLIIDSYYQDKNCARTDDTIIYIGRISPSKQCHKIIDLVGEAAKIMRKQLHLHIFGRDKSENAYVRLFKRTIEQAKKNPYIDVKWHDKYVPTEVLANYLNRATLYVSTSLHEGFGLPVIESIFCGCPSLYYSCGGTESLLDYQGCIPPNDDINFIKTIVKLLTCPEARNALSFKQKEKVRFLRSPHIINQVVRVYSEYLLNV